MIKLVSKRQKDTQQIAQHFLDTVVPDAEPAPEAQPAEAEWKQEKYPAAQRSLPGGACLRRYENFRCPMTVFACPMVMHP